MLFKINCIFSLFLVSLFFKKSFLSITVYIQFSIMVSYLYNLQSDPPNMSSIYLAPYMTLLTIFPILHFIYILITIL